MSKRHASSKALRVVPSDEERATERAASATDSAVLSHQQISELKLLDQFSRIGGKYTPLVITQIIQEADTGRPARLVDLLHESRQKSGHLHGVMQAFELQIQELEYQVAPPKNATALETRAAEECCEAFKQAGPEELIAHLAGEGTWFGFAHSEIIWRKEARHLWPERFSQIACRRFAFTQSDGALLFDPLGQGYVDGGRGIDLLKTLPEGKIIQHTPRVNGDVRVREGLARCLVWMAMFANWTVRDWMQLAEMAWKPKGFGKYKRGASNDDRAALRLILQQALATGYAIFNEETTGVDLVWPQQASSGRMSPHKELVSFFAQEISKAVLGNPTSIEPGENGARSSDEIRERMMLRIREAVARGVASAIQRYYVRPFFAMNYGIRARAGLFGFNTAQNVDLAPFATGVKALVDAGHRNIPESWINDQVGIPPRGDDEPALGDVTVPGTSTDAIPVGIEETEQPPAEKAETHSHPEGSTADD
jgi:phage gp29-like protein